MQHVSNVEEIRTKEGVLIHGQCLPQTSINKQPYKVEVLIDDGRRMKSAHCNCISGILGLCKHTSALVCFINSERTESCTDNLQEWQKPSQKRQALYPKGETIESLFKLTPFPPPTFEPEAEKLENFVSLLKLHNETNGMFFKSLSIEPSNVDSAPAQFNYPPNFVEKLFFSEQPTYRSKTAVSINLKIVFKNLFSTIPLELQKYFLENVDLSEEGCKSVFLGTVGQAKNPEWFIQRKNRISASKAHKLAHARKKETRLKYFFENLPINANMRYGQDLEPKARAAFELKNQTDVFPSGLIVKPSQTWLCASPDGLLINEFHCLEIKCPSSCKEQEIKVDYILNEALVKSHPYYTQVQLQMYVMNTQKCKFFIYSENDHKELHVNRDDEFL